MSDTKGCFKNEKLEKYLSPSGGLKKNVEHDSDYYTHHHWSTLKESCKEAGRIVNLRNNWNHPDNRKLVSDGEDEVNERNTPILEFANPHSSKVKLLTGKYCRKKHIVLPKDPTFLLVVDSLIYRPMKRHHCILLFFSFCRTRVTIIWPYLIYHISEISYISSNLFWQTSTG